MANDSRGPNRDQSQMRKVLKTLVHSKRNEKHTEGFESKSETDSEYFNRIPLAVGEIKSRKQK